MIYVYGITRKNGLKTESYKGIRNQPTIFISFKDISAVVTQLPSSSFAVNQGSLLQHAAVIETYFLEETIIPFRFGTVIQDHDKVLNTLKEHYADFTRQLIKLEHKVEFGLKTLLEGSNLELIQESCINNKNIPTVLSEGKGPGLHFLLEKYKQMRDSRLSDEVAKMINQRLGNLFCEHKHLEKSDPQNVVDLVYLVTREKIPKFKKAVKELGSVGGFLLTGPWPPYNFVTDEV